MNLTFQVSADPVRFERMTTAEMRASFLVEGLFAPGKIVLVYSDADRAIVGSAVPGAGALRLESCPELASRYFTERREIGVMNIGGAGRIIAAGKTYAMGCRDALYIGRGIEEIEFASNDPAAPAQYYLISYPAHAAYPVTHAKVESAEPLRLGSLKESNQRTLYKYIHPAGIKSCQLIMGFTELEEGSVWNTMPAHTHARRSEIYLYFNLGPKDTVCHLMGRPGETRHLIVRDKQVAVSPSWSVHSGAGTRNYSFIWAMGGENQDFKDMQPVEMEALK
jgi:4-deoxy-L-threo-5-hexosulose-uronate ketol-isomerase